LSRTRVDKGLSGRGALKRWFALGLVVKALVQDKLVDNPSISPLPLLFTGIGQVDKLDKGSREVKEKVPYKGLKRGSIGT